MCGHMTAFLSNQSTWWNFHCLFLLTRILCQPREAGWHLISHKARQHELIALWITLLWTDLSWQKKGYVWSQHPATWGHAILDAIRTAQNTDGLHKPAKTSRQHTSPYASLCWQFLNGFAVGIFAHATSLQRQQEWHYGVTHLLFFYLT